MNSIRRVNLIMNGSRKAVIYRPYVKMQQRAYAQWLFGYDGVHDCFKRKPRNFWVRFTNLTVDGFVLLGMAYFLILVGDTDTVGRF